MYAALDPRGIRPISIGRLGMLTSLHRKRVRLILSVRILKEKYYLEN